MENTYAKTLTTLLARLPLTMQVPSHLLAKEGDPRVPHDLRRFARKRAHGEMLCQILSTMPTVPRGAEIRKVMSLDVSRSGFCFLLDQQLYPGEEVMLWTLIGKIPCEVARCLKHDERCYEIGVVVQK